MNNVSKIFRFVIPIFVGLIMYGLVLLLSRFREPAGFHWTGILWFVSITFLFWEGSRLISKKTERKFPPNTPLIKKLVWQLILLIVFGVLVFNAFYLLVRLYEIYIYGNTGNPFSVQQFLTMSGVAVFLVLAVGGFQMGVFYLLEWQKSRIETERLQKEQTQALFQNLKHQISPHFLFNNLNTLNSLIHESPEVASKFLSLFSEVYRYSLQQRDEEVVSLESELEMLESYLYLLKQRFENAFTVDIQADTISQRKYIPPMSLQLLVENALKHNIAEPANPLNIKIVEQNNALLIENNLQPRKEKKPSTQIGLSNLTERYRLLGQPLPKIEKTAEYFRVTLPLLTIGTYEVIHH